MSYDAQKIKEEIAALRKNHDLALAQYHKICGAIEIMESMLKEVEGHTAPKEEIAEVADLGREG